MEALVPYLCKDLINCIIPLVYDLDSATQRDDLLAIEWLLEHKPMTVQRPSYLLDYLVWHGHLHLLKYFNIFKMHELKRKELVKKILKHNWVDILKEFRSKCKFHFTVSCLNRAIGFGTMENVNYLEKTFGLKCNHKAIIRAIKCHNLESLKWLKDNHPHCYSRYWDDMSLPKAHLEVLQNVLCGFNPTSRSHGIMHFNNKRQHAILKWIKENVYSPIVNDIAGLAIQRGNEYVANWLLRHFPDVCITRHAINMTAGNGHVAALEWIKEHNPHFQFTQAATDWAAVNGHVDVLQWFLDKYPHWESYTDYAFCESLFEQHWEVANWFVEKCPLISPYQSILKYKYSEPNCHRYNTWCRNHHPEFPLVVSEWHRSAVSKAGYYCPSHSRHRYIST